MKAIIFELDGTVAQGFSSVTLSRKLKASDVMFNYEQTRSTTRDQYAYAEIESVPAPAICDVDLNPQPIMIENPAYDPELPEDPITNPSLIQDGTYNVPLATNIRQGVVDTSLPRSISRKELTYMLTSDERADILVFLQEFPAGGTNVEKRQWAKARDAWQLFTNGDPIERDLIIPDIHATIPVFLLLLTFFESLNLLAAGRAQELFDA